MYKFIISYSFNKLLHFSMHVKNKHDRDVVIKKIIKQNNLFTAQNCS